MKGSELKEKLFELMEENEVSTRDLAWDTHEESFTDVVKDALGDFEMVQGPERTRGDGDYDGAQAVLYFKDHDVYISVEGSYSSDEGMTFEDIDIVEPKVINETVYVSKKD